MELKTQLVTDFLCSREILHRLFSTKANVDLAVGVQAVVVLQVDFQNISGGV